MRTLLITTNAHLYGVSFVAFVIRAILMWCFKRMRKTSGSLSKKDRILNVKIAIILSFRAYLNEKVTIFITFYKPNE